jgi:hypothetical protein
VHVGEKWCALAKNSLSRRKEKYMPFQYISHPNGTPAEKCMVYPLSAHTGAEAYMLYTSASGVDKWKELYAKIEVESDALRGACGVYPTVVLADEMEEHHWRFSPKKDEREQYEQYEREHSSFREFIRKLGIWIGSLVVYPEGFEHTMIEGTVLEGTCENLQVISDKNLGDTVIVTITVLPINISLWEEMSELS